MVWAIPVSLAATWGITIVFSSSGYLDVSVRRVSVFRQYIFNILGCPIRKSTTQRLFAPYRSLSQLITSFIASEILGILHALLITFFCYSFFHLASLDTSVCVSFCVNTHMMLLSCLSQYVKELKSFLLV